LIVFRKSLGGGGKKGRFAVGWDVETIRKCPTGRAEKGSSLKSPGRARIRGKRRSGSRRSNERWVEDFLRGES